MFKIAEKPTFWRRVECWVPNENGTKTLETFRARFEALSPEEADEYDNSTQGMTKFLKRVIQELDELADAGGKPVAYSEAVRDAALKLPWARLGLLTAYTTGVAGAKEGN